MGFGRQHQAMQRNREGFREAIELIEGNVEPASFECGNRVDGPPELFGKASRTPATSNAQAFAVETKNCARCNSAHAAPRIVFKSWQEDSGMRASRSVY